LYDILEERGFEVYLVNARHTKNLPGRKSDVQECQWLLKLHTYGLLNNSFQPTSQIRVLRTYWRQRAEHVQAAASCIQRMQKALTQMNVQLANVLSDISGVTGQAIIKAILTGERDPHKLAAFRDVRVKASEGQIAQYLEGHWQEDLLFVLQQEKGFRFLPEADGCMRRAAQAVSPAARGPQPRCSLAGREAEVEAQKEEREHAAVRTARGVVSHERYGSDPD